jgi:hypothetical protein
LLAWRLVLELRTLGLREWLCKCGGLEGAHGFRGVLELSRLVEEERWVYLVERSCLGALLVNVFTLKFDMCHLAFLTFQSNRGRRE